MGSTEEKCTKIRYIQKPHLQVILISLMGRVVVVIFFADCRWNCDACHSDILAPKAESRLHVESATGIQLRQHQKSSLTTLSPHILKTSSDHHSLRIQERKKYVRQQNYNSTTSIWHLSCNNPSRRTSRRVHPCL